MADPELTKQIHEAMPLCATLGIDVDEFNADRVVMGVEFDERLCTSGGLLHGGLVMAMADAAGAACAALHLPEGAAGHTTIESKTNFLGGVREGRVVATSRVLHKGSTMVVVETDVRRAVDDRLVAKVTQTQLVLRAR